MQKTAEEQEVLVRGSDAHKDYLRYQFGRIKDTVNSFETRIAVSGRAMLLVYVVYITVKAGVASSLPSNMPAWINAALVVLDIVMLAMQVLGLEGSVPGLRHLAEELEDKNKTKEAKTVRMSSNIAQWLLAATAIDIVLQRNHIMGPWDLTNLAIAYTNGLFVLRVVVIGLYLVAMAKLEHQGPKIISAHEAAKKEEEAEQKQIKIDNANIMSAVEKGIETWTKPMVEAMKGSMESQMQQILTQHMEDRTTLKAQIEAVQMASSSVISLAEIGRQSEELTQQIIRQVDAKLSASVIDIDALTQNIVRQVHASMPTSANTSPINIDALTHLISERVDASRRDLLRQIDAKLDAKSSTPPAHQPVARQVPKAAPARPTSDTEKITAINGMTKAAFFAAFDEKPELLRLSSYNLAKNFGGRNATEPTARRAKNEYLETHPELKVVAV